VCKRPYPHRVIPHAFDEFVIPCPSQHECVQIEGNNIIEELTNSSTSKAVQGLYLHSAFSTCPLGNNQGDFNGECSYTFRLKWQSRNESDKPGESSERDWPGIWGSERGEPDTPQVIGGKRAIACPDSNKSTGPLDLFLLNAVNEREKTRGTWREMGTGPEIRKLSLFFAGNINTGNISYDFPGNAWAIKVHSEYTMTNWPSNIKTSCT